MKQMTTRVLTLLAIGLSLSACHKKPAPDEAAAPPVAQASAAEPMPSAEPAPTPAVSASDAERAQLQRKMDLARKEAEYINDPKAQWASAAKAGPGVSSENAQNAVGAVDQQLWWAQGVAGIDWLEAEFPKPVSATEVRVALYDGVHTMAQLELQDTTGTWHTVWSGVSEEPNSQDNLTWWVRRFDKTPYAVQRVKVSMAAIGGNRAIDSVQLVGE